MPNNVSTWAEFTTVHRDWAMDKVIDTNQKLERDLDRNYENNLKLEAIIDDVNRSVSSGGVVSDDDTTDSTTAEATKNHKRVFLSSVGNFMPTREKAKCIHVKAPGKNDFTKFSFDFSTMSTMDVRLCGNTIFSIDPLSINFMAVRFAPSKDSGNTWFYDSSSKCTMVYIYPFTYKYPIMVYGRLGPFENKQDLNLLAGAAGPAGTTTSRRLIDVLRWGHGQSKHFKIGAIILPKDGFAGTISLVEKLIEEGKITKKEMKKKTYVCTGPRRSKRLRLLREAAAYSATFTAARATNISW